MSALIRTLLSVAVAAAAFSAAAQQPADHAQHHPSTPAASTATQPATPQASMPMGMSSMPQMQQHMQEHMATMQALRAKMAVLWAAASVLPVAVVGVLDWEMSAQQATSMVDFGAANGATTYVGGEHPHIRAKASSTEAGSEGDALLADLRAKGHRVNTAAQISGVATIVKTRHQGQWVLEGGADPRREGIALGDALLH